MAAPGDLLRQVRACRICETHLPLAPRPILQWHPAAKILIAGQAPGTKAHAANTPFDDPSGDRLRRWLGVDRATFYDATQFAIIPMGFCYPGKGKSGDLPPRPECAPAWRQALLDGLPALGLTLVIGMYALEWHLKDTRKRTLTETVADWQTYWPTICPLPHPSPRNLRWFKQNPWFEDDVVPSLQARVKELLALH